MKDRIKSVLDTKFQPESIEVIDESHHHRGHLSNRLEAESHFKIIIKCKNLEQLKSLDAHRLIYQALIEEMKLIHALKIEIE